MTPQPTRNGAFAKDADALQQFAAQQEFAFADVAHDGTIRSLNPFARLCWGWNEGERLPEDVLFILEGMPPEASEVLPLKKGDLLMHGVRRGSVDGWMLVGYERIEELADDAEQNGFDTLIRNMPAVVMRMRTDGTVEFANPETERRTGYALDEIVGGRFWSRVVLPEYLPAFESALRSVTRKRTERLKFDYRAADGLVRKAEIHLFFSDAYEIEAVLLDQETTGAPAAGNPILTALDQGPDGFMFIDMAGTIRYANHRVRELVGIVTVDAWLDRQIEEAQGFDRSACAQIRRCLRDGEAFSRLDASFSTSTGSTCRAVLSGSPTYGESGRVGCGLQVRLTPEAERSNDQRHRFSEAAARLREIATASPDESVFLDSACGILAQAARADRVRIVLPGLDGMPPTIAASWSGRTNTYLTTDEQDREVLFVVGQTSELYVGPDSERHAAVLADVLSIEEAYWIRIRANGADAFVVFERMPDEASNRSAWSQGDRTQISNLIELTESLWSWIGVVGRYRHLSEVMEDVQFAFVITDSGARRFRYLSNRIEDLVGRSPHEWTGNEVVLTDWVEQVVHPEDRSSVRAHDRVLEQGVESRSTYRILHRDGSIRWVSEHAVPVAVAGGTQVISGIMTDITERRAAEALLIRSKSEAESASRQKTAFIATLSHEMRTPIGAVHGYAELLERELRDLEQHGMEIPATLKEFVTTIEDRSRRLVSLVQDLFDLSAIEMGQVTVQRVPVPLHSVVGQSAAKMTDRLREKGITMRLQLDSRDPKVLGDARRVEQIIDGLISNAVKFTSEGSITVRTRAEKRDVVVEVIDTGIGITRDYQEKLFTPFTQEEDWRNRRFDGTGLGLSLVKRLLDMLGGRIEVDSEKDRGSTFRVYLPAVRGTAARGVQLPRAPRA